MIFVPKNTESRNEIAARELVASGEVTGPLLNSRGVSLYTMSTKKELLHGIHFHIDVDGVLVYFGALKRNKSEG